MPEDVNATGISRRFLGKPAGFRQPGSVQFCTMSTNDTILPEDNDLLFRQAASCFQQGRLSEAGTLAQRILCVDPAYADASHLLGLVAIGQGDYTLAERHINRAIESSPGKPVYFYNLGHALRSGNNLEGALSAYDRALLLNPGFIEVHINQGMVLFDLGRLEAAITACESAIRLDPRRAYPHYNRGNALYELGRPEEALSAYDQALALDPDNARVHTSRGNVLSSMGRVEEALSTYERALELNPDNVEARYNSGLMLELQGRLEDAYLACSHVLESIPDDEPARALQIEIRRRQGRYDEAITLLEPLVNAGIKHPQIAETFIRLCNRMNRCEEAIDISRDVCQSTGHARQDLMCLYFATGHTLDRLGRFDEAFAHFEEANQLRNKNHDITGVKRFIDACIDAHSSDPVPMFSQYDSTSPRLIFIIGMPRSGTTLAEQILSSHPDVFGAGELGAMPDIRDSIARLTGGSLKYPRCMGELDAAQLDMLRKEYIARLPAVSHGVPVVTDKHLGNSLSVGLIRTLFPDATFVHCIRDPLDACLSCYMNNFSVLPYSYDLTSLGQTWREHQRLMQHWQNISIPMMTLSYEALVADQERVSRQLVEYCGLVWDEACLKFHENDRKVLTVSFDQVNQPMYNSSVGRWKNYETHLGPLVNALNGKL